MTTIAATEAECVAHVLAKLAQGDYQFDANHTQGQALCAHETRTGLIDPVDFDVPVPAESDCLSALANCAGDSPLETACMAVSMCAERLWARAVAAAQPATRNSAIEDVAISVVTRECVAVK